MTDVRNKTQIRYLIAEYCGGTFYMGWHLYLRDSRERQKRNADGSWGWLRAFPRHVPNFVKRIFDTLSIELRGDGTCDGAGISQIADRFPMGRQRIWGKRRGCIPVVEANGRLWLIPGWHAL